MGQLRSRGPFSSWNASDPSRGCASSAHLPRASGRAHLFDPATINARAFDYYPRLARLERYVGDHPDQHLSLHRAAAVVGLSDKYFSDYFRQKTGVCFRDWQAHVRVSWAMELMSDHNDSITNVCLAVGFRDLRTFERAFKRHTGLTPRAYRRTARPC